MIPADEKHLTLVCYRSGYGGDFLCALLDQAVGNLPFDVRDANNRYWGKNYVFSVVNEHVKSLHHIFSYYQGGDSVPVIDSLSEKFEWAGSIKKIIDMCYDEDEDEFIENLTHFISTSMRLPYKYNFGNLHFAGEFPKFNVRKLHNNMGVVFLKTDDPLYFQYFHALAYIKTNFQVLRSTRLAKKEIFDSYPILDATEIDVGKLFFEDSLDDSISSTLSKVVGTDLKLDFNELKDYRAKNDLVLKTYFGDDYKSMDAETFRSQKLDLLRRVAAGENYKR